MDESRQFIAANVVDVGDTADEATPPPHRLWAVAKFAAAVGAAAALLLTGAAINSALARPAGDTTGAATELTQIVAQNPVDMCSKPWFGVATGNYSEAEANCASTKCCKITGEKCYQKKPGLAGCLKTCKAYPGSSWDCKMPHDIVPLVEVKEVISTTKLYCFGVYVADTGSTKKCHDLELLRMQYEHSWSIFSCSVGFDVFADVSVKIGSYTTIKISDVEGDWHLIKRKKTGTWVNTGAFKQAWKKLGTMDAWKAADWVVKADADAVFLPERLVLKLMDQPVSWTGVYFENCMDVLYGYFGNLEVFSKQAFDTLVSNVDFCQSKINWASEDATKWGPIGEDLFAQKCMDMKGVTKLQNFELSTDGACPAIKKRFGVKGLPMPYKPPCDKVWTPSIHPYKKPTEWEACYHATAAR